MTAEEVLISDWSSDVCSADLRDRYRGRRAAGEREERSGNVARRRGARGAAAAPRRARARDPIPPASRRADRRAARLAARGGLWRGGDLSRLGRARAGAVDAADRVPRGGRDRQGVGEGQRVSVRVVAGGRRRIEKKTKN